MLAIDWGTSSLRVYRLDASGRVADVRASTHGILNVRDGDFAGTLEHVAGDWLASDRLVVMSGMIGSRQGWVEAAYLPCPAGIADIASAMARVSWRNNTAWIVPGLRCRDGAGVNDVMRGEEAQILGLLERLDAGENRICLPGTHSKWAVVRDTRIISFTTYMTGEVFALLKQHSILGRTMAGDAFHQSAFVEGVTRAYQHASVLHHVFGARAQVLGGELADSAASAYLSGILIGEELRCAAAATGRFHLAGRSDLANLYAIAAAAVGLDATVHQADTVAAGLYRLTQCLPQQT